MIQLSKKSIIYVLAPGNLASGGPEALHQLHYYLIKSCYQTRLVYFQDAKLHPQYEKYTPQIIPIDQVVDSEENVIIVPEMHTIYLNQIKKARKCIWWLGLQFYDGFDAFPQTIRRKIKSKLRKIIPSSIFELRKEFYKKFDYEKYLVQAYKIKPEDHNLCGSMFTYQFTKERFNNVHLLVEPLGLEFLDFGDIDLSSKNRGNKILYNPSKSSTIMKKLLTRTDLEFEPIQGLDVKGMKNLFQQSKLYVDFGKFPGPERLPKETVLNGTMLLVGKRNASENNFDVAIPEQYKLEDFNNEELVVSKIKDMLANYDELIGDFDFFRKKVKNLEQKFIESIRSIFIVEKA